MNRFMRFAIAGAGGFVVQLATLAVLVAAHMHYVAATIIAVEAAILLNFVFHERWTWKDRGRESGLSRFLRFNALTAVDVDRRQRRSDGLTRRNGFNFADLANVISVIVLGAINFVGSRSLVFRDRRARALLVVVGLRSAQADGRSDLKAKTASDFAKYVAAVEARRARDIANHEPFLDIERLPAAQLATTLASLKRGEVIVTRGGERDGSGERAVDRRRAGQSLARDGVRAESEARRPVEGPAGTAERQTQAGRRAVVARRVA